jgi:hypothetical protein
MPNRAMEDEHYAILDVLSERSVNTRKRKIVNRAKEKHDILISKGNVREVLEKGLIRRSDDEDFAGNHYYSYDISDDQDVHRMLSNWRLKNSVRELDHSITELKDFQSKSSSVETIFTLAILGFTFIQATGYNIPETQAFQILVFVSAWALLLGGYNLLDTTISSMWKFVRKIWWHSWHYLKILIRI